MVKLLNKSFIILCFILILGFFLRANNFTQSPRMGSTFDEYAWTWLGISLIKEAVPSSWSSHEQYEGARKHLIYQGAAFWIVKPYLEHPPFFGLVAGSFAMLNGASNMYEVTIDKIRPLAIILGTASIALLFLLIREVYNEKTALLSALIYAIIPTVVIGSRIVQNENFFIPMFLAVLLLTVKFLKTKKSRFRNAAAILCGLLIISKIPWIAAALGVIAILFYAKKYKDGGKVLAIVLVFFLTFIAYGLYFNQDLFISLWKLQLQRYDLTFNSVFALFTQPFLVDRYMLDGWIYFGWFAFILLLVKDLKKNFIVVFGLLVYLAVFIFAIPNEPGHGWYRYPFYPFLAISLALFIRQYFNKNLLLTLLFILFIGLSLFELTWAKTFGFSFGILRLFLIASASSLLPLFFSYPKLKKYSRAMNYLLLLLIFSLSVWAIFSFVDL